MRGIVATMLVLAPLLAACGKAEEPLIPIDHRGRFGEGVDA